MAALPIDNSPQVVHHPTLYFSNGDIILSAPTVASGGNTVLPRQLFRVHRFILSHHSHVFADMFSLPIPENAGNAVNEMYERAPLIALSDDASDLASLLSALYDPSTVILKRMDPNTPFLIRGILRLATKYAIEPLRVRLLEHFAADWPRTLVEWDRVQDDIDAAFFAGKGTGDEAPVYKLFPEPAIAVSLAREFGCMEVLPAAFYYIATTSAQYDWDDGRDLHQAVRWDLLDSKDFLRITRARELLAAYVSYMQTELLGHLNDSTRMAGCPNPGQCARLRETSMQSFSGGISRFDPLGIMRGMLFYQKHVEVTQSTLCLVCRAQQDKVLNHKKQEVWDDLPSYFGLDIDDS
ncbi:hypothetical protein B0H21DRAFT_263908 [Amylocystis lapponica]|nr:hypothetical protein B0H21DRAFT_263908 [Amylocystis lapponica]